MKLKDLYIVLDLDNTLIHAKFIGDVELEIQSRDGLEYFLNFISKKCKGIIIWTSGNAKWMKLIVSKFMDGVKIKELFHRNHCEVLDKNKISPEFWKTAKTKINDVNDEILIKNIDIITKKIKDATRKNVLFIDDFELVSYKNMSNLYHIRRFSGNYDSELFRLCCWLNKLNSSKFTDIRNVPKNI